MNVSATGERECDAEPWAAVIALAIVGIQMLLLAPLICYLQSREPPADIEIVAYESESDDEVVVTAVNMTATTAATAATTAVAGLDQDPDAPAPTPCTPILLRTVKTKAEAKTKDEQEASDDELELTGVPFAFGTDCHSPLNADVLTRLVRLRALRTQLDSVLSQTHAQILELEAMC